MTENIKIAAGTDLDGVFDPYVQGTKPALTNIKNSTGEDLRDRYAPISYGTAAAATGIKISTGADINTLFAKIGTAVYQTINGSWVAGMSINIPIGWTGAANITYPYTLSSNGTGSKPRGPTLAASPFDWTSDGAPPIKAYEIRLTGVTVTTPNGAWAFTNGIPAYVPLDSTHGCTICTLKFIPSTNSGQGPFEATGLLEIREVATGTIVKSSNITISGNAGSI